MPYFPSGSYSTMEGEQPAETRPMPPPSVLIKNRRKRYLDKHPEYFSADLELADPLLYDRLIRRFQTPAEREAEGRKKGFSGVLHTDIMRSEAKLDALAHPDPHAMLGYSRGPHGEILAEDKEDIPTSKEEGEKTWQWEMGLRFIRGEDRDFDYKTVDENDEYDDWNEEQERYFDEEEPEWLLGEASAENIQRRLQGETGVQDF